MEGPGCLFETFSNILFLLTMFITFALICLHIWIYPFQWMPLSSVFTAGRLANKRRDTSDQYSTRILIEY